VQNVTTLDIRYNLPMPGRFQFSLRALLLAMLLAGTGLWLLGKAERVRGWEFTFLVSSGFAAFGAAAGIVLGKVARRTAYWAGVGLFIALWALID